MKTNKLETTINVRFSFWINFMISIVKKLQQLQISHEFSSDFLQF